MPTNVSEKQLAANRRNAEKSTGPERPTTGRPHPVRMRPSTGCSRGISWPASDQYNEDAGEFLRLLKDLATEYKPATPVESFLVERIGSANVPAAKSLSGREGKYARSNPLPQSLRPFQALPRRARRRVKEYPQAWADDVMQGTFSLADKTDLRADTQIRDHSQPRSAQSLSQLDTLIRARKRLKSLAIERGMRDSRSSASRCR